jgi:hypothetical protein
LAIVGLILYIVDVGSDSYMLFSFYINGQMKYFSAALIFILLPSLLHYAFIENLGYLSKGACFIRDYWCHFGKLIDRFCSTSVIH